MIEEMNETAKFTMFIIIVILLKALVTFCVMVGLFFSLPVLYIGFGIMTIVIMSLLLIERNIIENPNW